MPTCISVVQRPAQTLRRIPVPSAQGIGRRVLRHQVSEQSPTHSRPCHEMLATRLGLALGLPMPRVEGVEVSDWLVEHTPELRIQLGGRQIPRRMKRIRNSILCLPMENRAELAFREAVDDVIAGHARLGLPLYIGRNGKVVKLPPSTVHRLSRSTHRT